MTQAGIFQGLLLGKQYNKAILALLFFTEPISLLSWNSFKCGLPYMQGRCGRIGRNNELWSYEEKSSMGLNPTIRIFVLFHIHIFSYRFNAFAVNLRLTLLIL